MKTCCGYPLEAPQWGNSNEFPNDFVEKSNKIDKKKKCFLCSYGNIQAKQEKT